MGHRVRFGDTALRLFRRSTSQLSTSPTGIIIVNNQKATPDQIIQNGDLISNVAHRRVFIVGTSGERAI